MTRRTMSVLLSVVLVVAFSGVAQAVIFNPNTTLPLPGTTVAAIPNLAGTVVVDDIVPFAFAAYGGTVSGNVQVRVVNAIDGTYDFYWRVFNDANSAGAIGDFRIGNFFTSVYDANWRIDGLGDVPPLTAHRFDGAFSSYMNFNFASTLVPGASSMFMFLDTNATSYAKNAIYDLTNVGESQISSLFSMYGPSSVPEPATLLLLGAGIAGAGLLRKRIKR